MNKSTLKTVLYIVLGVIVVSAIVKLFFAILPYLLIGGLVLWGVFKIVGFVSSKKEGNSGTSYSQTENISRDDVFVDDTVDTSSAIDVDFEDVEK